MALLSANGGAVVLLFVTLFGIFIATRTAAAAAIASVQDEAASNNNNLVLRQQYSPAKLASFNALLSATRADLRTLFPNKEDLMRFVLTHRQALLRALEQQDAPYEHQQQDDEEEENVARASEQPMLYRPSIMAADAEQSQVNAEPWQKRAAQATYLRFGRSARLRFGKRALSALDDIILGETGHTAARRSARLRFG